MDATRGEDTDLRCPVLDKSICREDVAWVDPETGQFACPACGGLHDEPEVLKPPADPAPLPVDTSGVRLFSLWAITFTALVGSSIAGGILLCVNYHRMHRPRAGWFALVGITLFSLITLVPSLLLGEDVIGLVPLGLAIGGELLSDDWPDGTPLELNQADTIYYTGDATGGDARRLAAILETEEILGTPDGVDVLFEIDGSSAFVGLIYEAGDENDPELQEYLEWLRGRIAKAFPGHVLSVRVYDEDGELRRTFSGD